MDFLEISLDFYGISLDFLEISFGFPGFPLDFLDFFGFPRDFIEILFFLSEIEEIYELLLTKQREKVQLLTTEIEKKAASLRKTSRNPSKSRDNLPRLRGFLNISTASAGKTPAIASKIAKEKHKSQLLDKSFNETAGKTPANPANSTKSPAIPTKSQGFSEKSPFFMEKAQKTAGFRDETAKKPGFKEKERLLEEFSRSLQEKSKELARFSEENAHLRQKLSEFQQQNEENLRIFQAETVKNAHKCRTFEEKQRLLEAEVAQNHEKISELLLKNREIAKNCKNSEEIRLKLQILEEKLRNREKSAENLEKAEIFKANALKARVIHAWHVFFLENRRRKPRISAFLRGNSRKKLEFFFNQWQKYYFLEKIVKTKRQELEEMRVKWGFSSLKSWLFAGKSRESLEKNHGKRLVFLTFVSWKRFRRAFAGKIELKVRIFLDFLGKLRNFVKIKRKSQEFLQKIRKSRFFTLWLTKYLNFNRPIAIAKEFSRSAWKFHEIHVKTAVFRRFAEFSRVSAAKTRKIARSDAHYAQFSKKSRFSQWKSVLSLRNLKENQSFSLRKRKTRDFQAQILKKWHVFARFSKQKREKLRFCGDFFEKRRVLRLWKREYARLVKEKQAFSAISLKFSRKIVAKCFVSLKKLRYFSKRMRKCRDFLAKKCENALLLRVFRGFRLTLSRKRDKSLKVFAIFFDFPLISL